jgi:hypothetical protein
LPDLSVTNDPWLACIWRERLAGRLSVRELRVLVALYAFRDTADGWPTQTQLARQAGYTLTVCRAALLRARRLGLVAAAPLQGSRHAYRFLLPDGELPQ